MLRFATLITASFLLNAPSAWAAAGDLDTSFGNAGAAQLTAPAAACVQSPCSMHITAVAPVADGKLVFTGWVRSGSQPPPPARSLVRWVAGRVRADGAPDPTFGEGGYTTLPLNRHTVGARLAVLDDGRIVVGGGSEPENAGPDMLSHNILLVRLTADGDLDPTFDGDGIAEFVESGPSLAQLDGMVVQADGRIVVARWVMSQVRVRRFTANGGPDPTFGTSGGVTIVERAQHGASRPRLVLLPNQRLLVTALYTPTGGGPNVTYTARLLADGLLDATYGATGWSEPLALEVMDTVLQADGRLLVGGGTPGIGQRVGRLLANGQPDASFGSGVYATVPYEPRRLLLQPDGRILIGTGTGFTFTGFGSDFHLTRLRSSGARDESLQGTGTAAAGFNNGMWLNDAMALQPADGKIVLAGSNGTGPATLVRFHGVGGYDLFTDAERFVRQQYRDFLAREGDSAGIASWVQALQSGQATRASLAYTFLSSAEFEGRVAPIVRLYFAFFLRIPDKGGLDFWIGQFGSGMPLDDVSNAFAASPEFGTTYGPLTNAQFVERVYQNVLGRAPDAGGAAFWTGQLDSGALTRGALMARFSESAEYRGLIGSEVAVTMAYHGMLRRTADPGGFAYWVDAMDGGTSPQVLTGLFIDSGEYRARFLP